MRDGIYPMAVREQRDCTFCVANPLCPTSRHRDHRAQGRRPGEPPASTDQGDRVSPPPNDQARRPDGARGDPHERRPRTCCVEAGAGTGKTTSLVGRIVELLASGHATVDELAVITFTEKAAAELSARVREELEDAIADEGDDGRRERLAEAVRGLYRARIETIHAFATNLLRERPVEAGLDPEFRCSATSSETCCSTRLFGDWLDELLAEEQPEVDDGAQPRHGPRRAAARPCTLSTDHRYLLPLEPFDVAAADGSEVVDWLDANLAELEGIADRCTTRRTRSCPRSRGWSSSRERLERRGHAPRPRALASIARGMPAVSLGRGQARATGTTPPTASAGRRSSGRSTRELRERRPGRDALGARSAPSCR